MPLFRDTSQRDMERRVWRFAKKGKLSDLQTALLKDRQVVDAFHSVKGTTPLMIACKKGHGEVVRILLENGAQVNLKARNKRGNTALHIAAYYNSNTAVEHLLSANADIFLLNQRGHMALDLARFRNHRSVVEMISSRALVRKGWLHCRRVSGLGLVWKHRWCVVLASNDDCTALDLYLFKSSDDVRPMYVVQLSVGSHAMRVPFKVWIDRSNMFELDQSTRFQSFSPKEFSRNEPRHPPKASDSFRFAADSETVRDAWIATLSFGPEVLTSASGSWTAAQSGSFERPPNPSASNRIVEEQLFPMASPSHVCSLSPPPKMSQQLPSPSAPRESECDLDIDTISTLAAQSFVVDEAASPPAWHSAASDNAAASSVPSASFPPTTNRGECVICMDAEKNAICIPCGHIAGCFDCLHSNKMQDVCPICRAKIENVIKVYEC